MIEPAISALIIVTILLIYVIKIRKGRKVIANNSYSWFDAFFRKNSSLISVIGVFIAVLAFLYQPNSFSSLETPYLQYLKILIWLLNIVILILLFTDILKDIFINTKKVQESSLIHQLYSLCVLLFIIWLFFTILLKEIINLFSNSIWDQIYFLSNYFMMLTIPFSIFGKLALDKFSKKK